MSILGFDHADLRLIFNIWRMNLIDRYLGSVLGVAWAILNPLLLFALFTFVFSFVFKARIPGADTTIAYSLWLICGLGPWLTTTEALTSASTSIISNAGLVKNMAFKTETLPIALVFLGAVPLIVTFVFLLLLQLIMGYGWKSSLVWLPFVVVVQFLFLASLGVMIAAITTFVRDFGILLPNLLLIFLFSTPIFYPIEALPSLFQTIMAFNPFYIIANGYRAALLGEQPIPFIYLAGLAALSYGLLIFALAVFRRVKFYFSAVI